MTTSLCAANLQRLADIYHASAIGVTTRLRMSFDAIGAATCSFAHVTDFDHALHQVHGGLIATMMDNAGWFTAAATHSQWVVTSDLHMRLLQGTAGEDLRAIGTVVRTGRRQTVVAIEVFAASGIQVAMGSGTFCPTGKPLPFLDAEDLDAVRQNPGPRITERE